jgi:hypothetical protein
MLLSGTICHIVPIMRNRNAVPAEDNVDSSKCQNQPTSCRSRKVPTHIPGGPAPTSPRRGPCNAVYDFPWDCWSRLSPLSRNEFGSFLSFGGPVGGPFFLRGQSRDAFGPLRWYESFTTPPSCSCQLGCGSAPTELQWGHVFGTRIAWCVSENDELGRRTSMEPRRHSWKASAPPRNARNAKGHTSANSA